MTTSDRPRRPSFEDPTPRLGDSDDVLGGSARPPAAEPEDAVERWARRTGRGLAIVAAVVIVALFLLGRG